MKTSILQDLNDKELIEHAKSFSITQLEKELAIRLEIMSEKNKMNRELLYRLSEMIKNTDLLMTKNQGF